MAERDEVQDGTREREVAECPPPAPPVDWGLTLSDPEGAGARVDSVGVVSPAAGLLRPGDIVVGVDDIPIRTPEDLTTLLEHLDPGQAVLLRVARDGARQFVIIQKPDLTPETEPEPEPRAAAEERAPEPAPATVVVVQVPPSTVVAQPAAPAFAPMAGGVVEVPTATLPPSFSAPGIPRVPGATFAPPPGPGAQAFPQLPGISQPLESQTPLVRGPGGAAQPGVPIPGVPNVTIAQPGLARTGLPVPGPSLPGIAQPGVVAPGLAPIVQPGAAQPGFGQAGPGSAGQIAPRGTVNVGAGAPAAGGAVPVFVPR